MLFGKYHEGFLWHTNVEVVCQEPGGIFMDLDINRVDASRIFMDLMDLEFLERAIKRQERKSGRHDTRGERRCG
jgi:hypothetical protein